MNLSLQDGIRLLVYAGIGGVLFGFFAVLVYGLFVNVIAIVKKVF